MTISKGKRLLFYAFTALFIAVAAMFALSISASAATAGDFTITLTEGGGEPTDGTDYTYTDGVLTINTPTALTIKNTDTQTSTTNRIEVADGVSANITLAGVNIDVSGTEYAAAFKIADNSAGNVTITLADNTTNTLKSGQDRAGLQKNGEDENVGTLTICGTGSLSAQGGDYGAGIGGGSNGSAANITITDKAVVTATGGAGGAGIGGGVDGTLEDLIISGGSVKAVGSTIDGAPAPAIGSGVTSEQGYYCEGSSFIPTLADGRTLGRLFEISNPNGEDIVIDGVDYPNSHGSETKIYAYVSLTVHTIKAGDTLKVYEYYNGAFTEMVHGTDLSVSATNSGETLVHGVDYTYSSATGILTVLTDKYITIANTNPSTSTTNRIEVADGVSANITLAGVNINASSGAAFRIADNSTGDVTLTLADGSVNTLKGVNYYAGLQKNGADENVGTLTICGTGSLSAQGGTDGAGIGAYKTSTRNITISGGVVITATGGVGSAGIGGGNGGSAEDITITDNAVVTATGGSDGAGIGGGNGGSATGIIISDNAVVTASGKDGAAGIGGGVEGTLEDIIINGGSVNAIGSNYYEQTVGGADGANIGGGVILPPDPSSDPEEGAPVTPTLADGTTPVYLLELDVDGTSAVTINGKAYPTKHIDENELYVYLPVGYYTVANGGNEKLYHIADNGTASEVVVGTAFTITGTDLVYGTDYTYPADTGVLTILSGKAMTIANADTTTATNNRIEVADGVSANITLAGVNIDVFAQEYTAAFQIAENSTGNVTITLADGTTNTLKSGKGCAALQKNGDNFPENQGKLIITGNGTLNAEGCAAGIGGGSKKSSANIEIKGGKINALSRNDTKITSFGIFGSGGAGIGGGNNGGNGSYITISGGEVTATGSTDSTGLGGAGIGGGANDIGSYITISGGTVTAEGADGGACIGGGQKGSADNITISGGKVTATNDSYGAGIGGGYNGSADNIKISGGEVIATSKENGAGIGGGGGSGGSGSNIKISGGVVIATSKGSGAGIGGGSSSSGSNIKISGGTVTATGGIGGAGIGGGSRGSADNITISGGSVKAVAGTVYQNCVPAAIGQGVQYDSDTKVYSNGAEVTPTDGTENVYLLELDVDGTSAVTANSKAYPTKHFDENKVYIYLPAKTAQTPNEVTIGTETTKYCYDTVDEKWLKVVEPPAADMTTFTYNGEEHTYTLAESDYYTITDNTTQTNAGTYTVTVALKDGYIWNDGETAKEYTFTIAKAELTVTAESYTVKLGNPLPATIDYTVTGLKGADTKAVLDNANLSFSYGNGVTPSALGEYDIISSGDAEIANYKITYVDGTLTITEKAVQTVTASDVTLTYGDTDGKVTATTDGDGAISYSTTSDVISVAADGTITALKAGTATVTVKAAETFDYAEATKTISVTVNKAAVTVTAKSYTIKVGDTLPTYAYDVTGLVNGETLPIDVTISCTADGKTAGTFDIVVSGASASDNYTFSYTNGKLTVEESSTGGETGGESGGTEGGVGGSESIPAVTTPSTTPSYTGRPSWVTTPSKTTTTTTTTTTQAPVDEDTDDDTDEEDVEIDEDTDTTKPADDVDEPQIKGDNGKTGWEVIADEIADADDGDRIVVDMNGATEVPKNILEQIKGKDIELVIELDNGFTWTINGESVTAPMDIDLSVSNGSEIPVKIINELAGESHYVTITLIHNGDFGFTAVLSVDMGDENEGFYANLYWYTNDGMEFVCADKISSKGKANLTFTHASEYIIVIDEENHGKRVEESDDTDEDADSDVDNIVTEEDDDMNPATGIVISFTGVIISAAAVMISRKRKNK